MEIFCYDLGLEWQFHHKNHQQSLHYFELPLGDSVLNPSLPQLHSHISSQAFLLSLKSPKAHCLNSLNDKSGTVPLKSQKNGRTQSEGHSHKENANLLTEAIQRVPEPVHKGCHIVTPH